MKPPINTHPELEDALEPFVNAAGTTVLAPACDVLFIHGSDLTWGRSEHGFYLADVDADEHFEEVLQVVESRTRMRVSRIVTDVLPLLWPKLMSWASEAVAEQANKPWANEQELVGAAIASRGSDQMKEAERALGSIFGPGQLPLIADLASSSLVRAAHMLRQQQMAAAGMTDDRYRAMLYALRRYNLCERLLRVAYPAAGFYFELSLNSQGDFDATEVRDDARVAEIFRLKDPLANLKRGQETALALFIASYINTHYIGLPQAFACARYGASHEAEFDVVVPALRRGFEVKLYQSPSTLTENKYENPARDLRKQLPGYFKAGCERVYYVSNLRQGAAEAVLKRAQDIGGLDAVQVVAGGIPALLPVLNEIVAGLDYVRQRNMELEMEQRIVSAAKKSNKRPTKSSKGAKRRVPKK